MIVQDFRMQFTQTWRILEELVRAFDDESWKQAGCGYVTPARVAYHILLGIEYYTGSETTWRGGLGVDWTTMSPEALPSQTEVLRMAAALKLHVVAWLSSLDLEEAEEAFPWTGRTRSGVLLFLLRHTMYHIGEMNALLYVLRHGEVDDYWMKGFGDPDEGQVTRNDLRH